MLFVFLFHGCQENYTSPRIVLAASGVDHDELVSIAEPLLSDIPNATGTVKPKSVYVGGEYRRAADSSVCFMVLSHTLVIYVMSFIMYLCSYFGFFSKNRTQILLWLLSFLVDG
jgi:hypothetical protein